MSLSRFQIRRTSTALRPLVAAAALLLVATTGTALAQTAATPEAITVTPQALTVTPQALTLEPQALTLDTSSASAQLFSSSSDQQAAPAAEASLNPAGGANFANYMQYGGGQRRRYGAPRYRGNNTNADGSPKYVFLAGAGFTQPIGNTWRYLTPSYGIQVGGGRQFSRHFSVPLQFDYDHFGFTKSNLANESYIYTGDSNPSDNQIDANSHIWSFTLNPTYTLYSGEGLGAYVVAGVGFYHKVANLTAPQQEEYYDPFYGPQVFEVQGNFATFTSNAPGFNGGFGLTYKFSRFSNERFYGEVRYVFLDNSQRYGATVANVATYTGYNGYPANSNRTTYFPIKFGIRF